MARKNRRLPFNLEVRLRPASTDWVVVLTNGSGRTTLELTGTQEGVWQWAETAGNEGGIKPGKWWPVDIHKAKDVTFTHGEDFVVV